jgi:hypothetical protein
LQCLFILKFSQFLSWSLFIVLKLPASIDTHVASIYWHACSPVYYDGLWCPVDCQGPFCRFALFDYIIWLPYRLDLFLLILVHDHTVFVVYIYQ